MMENIRLAANSIIVKIIFSIIILAFIFTGVGGFLDFGSNHAQDERVYIAKIDGEGLSRSAFESEVQAAEKNAVSLMGDDEFLKNVRRSVLANQIDNFLSYKLAQSLKAQISDRQVENVIRQQPVFFENGRYSNRLFLRLLAENNYTPDFYVNSLRSAILQKQVMDALLLSDFVLPSDSDISILNKQVRNIYLTDYSIDNLDSSQFNITDDEIKDYYADHQQEFYHKKRLKMKYVTNFLPAIESDIKVSNADIQKYYNDNKLAAMSPEKRFYSYLLFDSIKAANQEYVALSKKSTKNKLAESMSKIGWLQVNDSLPDMIKNTNLAKEGDISKPVEQGGQFYIIRLDQIQKAQKLPYDYASAKIRDLIFREKADSKFEEQQQKMEKSANLATMEEIAKASGLELYTSNWTYELESFTVGRYPEIHDVAFSDEMIKEGKPTGKISAIIPIQKYRGSYIIQVTDYEDEGIASFDSVKDTIKDKLIAEKKKSIFAKDVDDKLAELKHTGFTRGINFSRRLALTRDTVDDSINSKTVEAVFSVVPSVDNSTFGAAVIDDGKAQFFTITSVTSPAQADDLSEKLRPEQLQLIQNYLSLDLRKNAKIEIMPNNNL